MSIRKRTWVSGGKQKTAWVLVYSNINGKRTQVTFSTKREAERRWLEISAELDRGSHVSMAESITVAQAGELWIERAVSEGLERSTYEEYRRVLRLHIIPRIGEVKLSQLNRAFVENFRDQLLKELGPRTAERVFSYFKIIMKLADDKDKVSVNVAEKVKIKTSKRHRSRPEFFQMEEVNSALSASLKLGPRYRAFAHLFWLHGLRSSEGRGLPWESVNLEKGTVIISQRADRWRTIGPPKSETSFRTIPMTPSCVKALTAWKSEVKPAPDDLVFPDREGRPMSYFQQISQLYDPIMFESGLTKTVKGKLRHLRSLHATRHTTASIWIEMGFSAKRVQTLIGHSSIQITFDLYGHLFDLKESAADMMRSVDDWVLKNGPHSDDCYSD
ncbi:tyrosine-type recombinase/integrase [Porphyrobacter algicida]|uniref:Tyrosine-type recombinase/integrase n=1 Tax=Qipengyuania algicida TaxID=1836209 RepID=A0A845AIY7_9SPHN|nr:tyrosine-type recombinase/integrase [Qipengyuania algicida]MXP29574.1 tyrosine-type recombinase/integrase [Qipengyuania algicida]